MQISIKPNSAGGHIIEIPALYQVKLFAREAATEILIMQTEEEIETVLPEPNFQPDPKKPAKVSKSERVCQHHGCQMKFKPASNASKYCPLHQAKKKKLSPEEEAELQQTIADIEFRRNNYTPGT